MKRADALSVASRAFAERLARMCNAVADGFESPGIVEDQARAHFKSGLSLLEAAEAFALQAIKDQFRE